MFGMEMMIKEFIGMTPDELKEQITVAMQQAQMRMEAFDQQQRVIMQNQIRITKLLEMLVAEKGLTLDSVTNEVNSDGPGKPN